ncbi:hypothetical protein ACJJTC_009937 [Scirpophaga incertulas]
MASKHRRVCINSPNKFCYICGRYVLKSQEWRLFIDSSKSSLKAVLLHNGNMKPSIPVAYSVSMKETYDNLGAVLRAIKYEDFKWQICGDLKVIAILMGLQGGFTNEAKIKEGVFTGPDIRKVIRDAC